MVSRCRRLLFFHPGVGVGHWVAPGRRDATKRPHSKKIAQFIAFDGQTPSHREQPPILIRRSALEDGIRGKGDLVGRSRSHFVL